MSSFALNYKAQNYAWGKPASSSLVYNLYETAGFSKEGDQTKEFAELWLGDHTNGPSEVVLSQEKKVELRTFIQENPEKTLGEAFKKTPNRLPFLFKILSI
mmetsp:Transcript_11949/g.10320  ORF Transcript_11949/g.10320 Transcript_11949/m.10320 type:complete len:101 (-) Transcript_11949:948-1250(-)